MKTASPPPPPPSVAVAATHAPPAPALELPRPRRGFFPRGPGPRLLIFALILGVYPSVLVNVFFWNAGVDGGFYRSDLSILRTHSLLLSIAGVMIMGALACLGFVLYAMWKESHARIGRALLAALLIATAIWDWMAVQWVRPQLMPIMTREDVIAYAEMEFEAEEFGLQGLDYDARVMRFEISVPQEVTSDHITSAGLLYDFCTSWGRLFAGPVDVLEVRLTRPDATHIGFAIPRSQCRDWYLQTRSRDRRPSALAAPGSKPLEFLWKSD